MSPILSFSFVSIRSSVLRERGKVDSVTHWVSPRESNRSRKRASEADAFLNKSFGLDQSNDGRLKSLRIIASLSAQLSWRKSG